MTLPPLVFSPLLATPWLALIAAAAALATITALIRRARGAAFRGLGFLLLFGVLCGPEFLTQTTRPVRDVALLVVDHSQSMAIGARQAMAARATAALQSSAGDVDLRTVEIPAAADGGTELFATIRNALNNIPADRLAGVIAVTDGEIADPDAAPKLPAPLTILLTAEDEETDRELRLLATPAFGLVGQTATFHFEVLDHGVTNGPASAEVTISEDGTAISQTVPIGQPVAVTIPIRHAGPTTVAIAAAALPGEVSLINNQAAFTINGIHKRLDVLMISGSPTQGERSWRLLLKSDPAIQLVHFTILRLPGEMIDADPQDLALVPFPVRRLFETDIDKFDLIILDRFDAVGLLPPAYLADVATYVRNGGALLAEVGPEFATADSLAFTPLGTILPAQPAPPGDMVQPFAPQVTELGSRDPVTAPFAGLNLPPWYRMEAASPSFGDVLMTGPSGAPLLILGTAGQGRAGMLLSDQFWLWTRGGSHAGPALPLLRRIVHWLLREPSLEAESLTAAIDPSGRLVIDRQTLAAQTPGSAEVTDPAGQTRLVKLSPNGAGRYEASLPIDQPGVWRITQGGLTAYAAATITNRQEYQDLAATAAILRPAAQNILWLGRGPAPPLAQLLRPRHATEIIGTSETPLLPPLPVLIVALTLLAASWWRERR